SPPSISISSAALVTGSNRPIQEEDLVHTFGQGRRGGAALAIGLATTALAVAACGSDNNNSSSSSSTGGGKHYNMTLIAGVKGDEFYITMNCGAQEQAKKLGVSLNFQGPDQFDPSLQTPVVNAVAAKKPDAVLIAPTDTK